MLPFQTLEYRCRGNVVILLRKEQIKKAKETLTFVLKRNSLFFKFIVSLLGFKISNNII